MTRLADIALHNEASCSNKSLYKENQDANNRSGHTDALLLTPDTCSKYSIYTHTRWYHSHRTLPALSLQIKDIPTPFGDTMKSVVASVGFPGTTEAIFSLIPVLLN